MQRPSSTAIRSLSSFRSALLTLGFLVLTGGAVFAQYNTAEIAGVITDNQGGVLPGVSVTATNVASGLKVERVTDSAGRFFLPGLPVGQYTVTAVLEGFKQFTERGVVLNVGQRIELSMMLEIGELTDTVTVN